MEWRRDPAGVGRTVAAALNDRPASASLLLVIDQFEEIVTAIRNPDQRREILDLLEALRAIERVRVVASRLFRTFAHAVAAPWASVFAAWSGAMFMYLRVDHWVPAMCRSLAAARLRQD
jgi:hypothetical protein